MGRVSKRLITLKDGVKARSHFHFHCISNISKGIYMQTIVWSCLSVNDKNDLYLNLFLFSLSVEGIPFFWVGKPKRYQCYLKVFYL